MISHRRLALTRAVLIAALGTVGLSASRPAGARAPVPGAGSQAPRPTAAPVLPVRMEPQNPIIVQYRRGEIYRREVRLIPRPGSGVKVRGISSQSPLVKAKLDPPARSDRQHAYRLRLLIAPRQRAGDFVAPLRLYTTDPRFPQLPLIVVGLALAGPAVSPMEVTVPALARGSKGRQIQQMQVFNRGGPVHLLRVDTGNPGLRAEILPKAPGHFYVVVLRYAGGWKPGQVTSTIRVRTDDRRDPVLTVPFRAFVQ